MESLFDKYKELDEIFWRDYIHVGGGCEKGTNIPCEYITKETKKKHMGDGTINIAQLMTYLYFCEKNGEKKPISLFDCILTLNRLSESAKEFYEPVLKWDTECHDFFVRDDCDQDDVIWGSWKMLHGKNVDPCHSPFVSQDQIWNLSPILAKLGREYEGADLNKLIGLDEFNDKQVRSEAANLGFLMHNMVVQEGYKIINPYLSTLVHQSTYLPSFKLDIQQRRYEVWKKDPKPIKVKRGANNWYYSGATLDCKDAFYRMWSHSDQDTWSIRKPIYKATVFFLDRIYEPIYKRITGKDFKHNSYYCYAATSGIWYNSKFKERFVQRFLNSLTIWEEVGDCHIAQLFEPNIAPLVIDSKEDWKKCEDIMFDWLYWYSQKVKGNSVYSPLEALTLYEWYKYMSNLK